MKHKAWAESIMKGVFFIAAIVSIVAVALICIFLFANGIPAMHKIGFLNFVLGTRWKPGNDIYGIFPMILGSVYVTGLAILFGVPIGIMTAVFMAFYCPKQVYGPLKAATELLAGIPSVVYGFFGIVVMVPLIRQFEIAIGAHGKGNCILTTSIILAIMILPSIIGVTESSLKAVPSSYYEGAVALGATHERAVFAVILPAAKSGVIAGVVLGMGRAIGETMAVVMVAGNQARIPTTIFRGVRTLTANIVLEMGYASGLHREALIATGVVLFVFILLINLLVAVLNRGQAKE